MFDELQHTETSSFDRLALYRWLARVFQRECDDGFLMWYRSEQGLSFLSSLKRSPRFHDGAVKVSNAVRSGTPTDEQVLYLAGCFSSLFYRISPLETAQPYESCYREDEGRLFGKAVTEVQAILAENGLGIVGFSEPADHISVHLQLMAHFTESLIGHDPSSVAAQRLTDAKRQFLREHLINWIPAFARDCMRFDKSGLYAGAAGILLALIEEHARE